MKPGFKTVLVEDEEIARKRLVRLLGAFGGLFDIIGQAANGRDGAQLINSLKPEVIFLDIQMPGTNGFEMLALLEHRPTVIFTTAYESYAIRAFEENSLDYLLKPIETERLQRTVEKLERFHSTSEQWNNSRVFSLLQKLASPNKLETFPVRLGERIILKRSDDVRCFSARDKSVYLCDTEGREFFVDYSLSALEEKLPEHFVRVQRSAIVNTRYVLELRKQFKGRWLLILAGNPPKSVLSGANYSERLRELYEL